MTKETLIIEAKREGYEPSQVCRTMTVGELISELENYDANAPVYLSHDNGYTFGGINTCDFRKEEETTITYNLYITHHYGDKNIKELFTEEKEEIPYGLVKGWASSLLPIDWQLDDGEDTDTNIDTDYCQYVCYPDPGDHGTYYLAVFQAEEI